MAKKFFFFTYFGNSEDDSSKVTLFVKSPLYNLCASTRFAKNVHLCLSMVLNKASCPGLRCNLCISVHGGH